MHAQELVRDCIQIAKFKWPLASVFGGSALWDNFAQDVIHLMFLQVTQENRLCFSEALSYFAPFCISTGNADTTARRIVEYMRDSGRVLKIEKVDEKGASSILRTESESMQIDTYIKSRSAVSVTAFKNGSGNDSVFSLAALLQDTQPAVVDKPEHELQDGSKVVCSSRKSDTVRCGSTAISGQLGCGMELDKNEAANHTCMAFFMDTLLRIETEKSQVRKEIKTVTADLHSTKIAHKEELQLLQDQNVSDVLSYRYSLQASDPRHDHHQSICLW